VVTRWNLDTGEIEQTLALHVPPQRMQWIAADQILIETSVLDLKNGDVVARFDVPHYAVLAGWQAYDLRLWFLQPGGAPRVACQTVRDEEVERLAKAIQDNQIEVVFGPDTPVNLDIQGGLSEEAIGKLKANLLRRKHPVKDNSKVTLTVRIEEGSAPPIRVREIGVPPTLPRPGSGGFPRITPPQQNVTEVPGLLVTCEAILSDEHGELWKSTNKFATSQGIGIIRADDLTKHFHDPVRRGVEAWASGVSLPRALYRENGNLVPYPRRIALKGD
jgi:hypothetical protein